MSDWLAESVLRKIFRGSRDGMGGMYIDADGHEICIDGWSDRLTDNELAYVQEILKVERNR